MKEMVDLTKENMELKVQVKSLTDALKNSNLNYDKILDELENTKFKASLLKTKVKDLEKERKDHIGSITYLEDLAEKQESNIKELSEALLKVLKVYS